MSELYKFGFSFVGCLELIGSGITRIVGDFITLIGTGIAYAGLGLRKVSNRLGDHSVEMFQKEPPERTQETQVDDLEYAVEE